VVEQGAEGVKPVGGDLLKWQFPHHPGRRVSPKPKSRIKMSGDPGRSPVEKALAELLPPMEG